MELRRFMKRYIILFFLIIIIFKSFSSPPPVFVIPFGSINSSNFGILDEANCLENKSKLIGGFFSISFIPVFIIHNEIYDPRFHLLPKGLTGFYYKVGLQNNCEFSFKSGLGSLRFKDIVYGGFIPINIDMGIKKLLINREIFKFSYKINWGNDLQFPFFDFGFNTNNIFKFSFLFGFHSRNNNFSFNLIPSFTNSILIGSFVYLYRAVITTITPGVECSFTFYTKKKKACFVISTDVNFDIILFIRSYKSVNVSTIDYLKISFNVAFFIKFKKEN